MLVTIFYRRIDGEKYRQNYFSSLRKYVATFLTIDGEDLTKNIIFNLQNKFPICYKWIRLSKKEFDIISKAEDKISEIQRVLDEYLCITRDSIDQINNNKNIKDLFSFTNLTEDQAEFFYCLALVTIFFFSVDIFINLSQCNINTVAI